MIPLNLYNIIEARNRIHKYIHKTPLLTSRLIDTISHSQLYFKCENFQKAGAFKYRGANNALLKLKKSELKKGLTTHSSGNHAGALALACQVRGISARIVMPESAPKIKIKAVRSYGAEIYFCEATQTAREEKLAEVIKQFGCTEIHPYNNWNIIEGQGTAMLEILEENPAIEIVVTPLGGGGLLSGTALAAKLTGPKIKVFGVEPKAADDAARSLIAGKIIPSGNPVTVADGLRTSLCDKTFEVISNYADDVLTVSEEQIIEAMKLIWERMKIVVEPSSAVTLAAVLANPEIFRNKKTALILSGGNADLENLPWSK